MADQDLRNISHTTIGHYRVNAEAFYHGTIDHDVSQNYQALLEAIGRPAPLKILDFGCGPGRDLLYFKNQGHHPTGLDGCPEFCQMAKAYSGCPVLEQDFLALDLKAGFFDGVFANASLFHVPSSELGRVLSELNACLRPCGILFSSNPRGDVEGWDGQRYGNYMEINTYERFLKNAGFAINHHYYRPPGQPRAQQPWLAVVAKKVADE